MSITVDSLLDLRLPQLQALQAEQEELVRAYVHDALHILLQGVAATVNIATVAVAAYTVLIDDGTLLGDATTNVVVFNLPSAVAVPGKLYTFKAINLTNAVTIVPNGAEVIDNVAGALSITPLYTTIRIQSDGVKWWKV